ncbi:type II CAAX endopeptidase family protein [uncultured Clostridium sp.]|uniref:CPBP family intramembrane glutamic endopeptidase n=1 Tax=uncultured Clostridium sp. TaxID=59620 RepID=UPI0028EFAE77|nr:type II CAAX endopeptidase family protein [uncultured Clostridium sp.]
MNFSKLNFFKPITNLEYDKISFSELGFFKGLSIVFLFFIINGIISIPIFILDKFNIGIYSLIKIILSIVATSLSIWLMNKIFSYPTNIQNNKLKFSRKDFIFIALLILGYRIFFDGNLSYLIDLIPEPKFLKDFEESLNLDPIYMYFSIIIIAPLQEEFINRGIILNGLLKKYSNKIAIIISALIFAIMHLNLQQGVNAFILGLFLGYIYIKTNSIYLTIFAHFFNNLLAFPLDMLDLIYINIVIKCILFTLVGGILMFYAFKYINLKPFNWANYTEQDSNS